MNDQGATQQPRRASWRRPIVLPVLLVALGCVLLLTNLGYLPGDVWLTLWKFWPLVLVLPGLEMILAQRIAWGSLILALIVLAVVAVVTGVSAVVGVAPIRDGSVTTVEDHQELADATSGALRLEFGMGNLVVRAQEQDGDLARWLFRAPESLRLERSYRVTDGSGRLDLVVRDGANLVPLFLRPGVGASLILELNRDIPLDLNTEFGAADVDLDLSDLRLQTIRVEGGASRVRIRFPSKGTSVAEVRGGAARMMLEVPEGVAARLVVESGAADVRVDEERFPVVSSESGRLGRTVYRSRDYDTAVNRLDLSVSVGVASVEIR